MEADVGGGGGEDEERGRRVGTIRWLGKKGRITLGGLEGCRTSQHYPGATVCSFPLNLFK